MSPVFHIGAEKIPFLIIHGENDEVVPYAQAVEFHHALKKAAVPTTLITRRGGDHIFFSGALLAHIRKFLAAHLSGDGTYIDEATLSEEAAGATLVRQPRLSWFGALFRKLFKRPVN